MAAPTPGSVNFGTIVAPDVAAEQMALARRQQMVDLLRQQALTPTEQQTAGGMAVPISPMNGFAKLAASYLAGQRQKDIDAKTLDLNKQMADRYAQILGGGAPASVAAPTAMAQGAAQQPPQLLDDGSLRNAGGTGPTVQNAARMDALTKPQAGQGANTFGMANLLRAGIIGQMSEPMAAAYADQFKLPEGVKTNNYYGIGTGEVAPAMRRELASKGNQIVSQDATLTRTDEKGNTVPLFTAPNLTTGLGIDWTSGSPVGQEIPGASKIAAARAGAVTQAQEEAKAGLDMVTVNTPQGPKMMTRAQAVQLAGGGAPAAGGAPIAPPAAPAQPQAAPARPVNPMEPQPRDADKTLIYQGELKAAQGRLATAKTPEEQQRAQNDIAGINREAKRFGIPLQTEGQQKFEQTMGTNQANLLDDGYKKAKIAADDLLGIEQSRKALQGGTFVGNGAEVKLGIAKFINANIPGVNVTPEKVTNTDYLKSTLGKGLLEQAKTLGSNPSNADANRINDIVGSIGKDPQALAKILDWRQQMSERAIQVHNANVGQAVKNGFMPQFDMTVRNPVNPSDIDALLRKYGGK